MQPNNLISQRNALEKDFQKWKQQRGEHLTTKIREIEAKSLFYKFTNSSSNFSISLLKSPQSTKTNQQLSSAKNTLHKPIAFLQGSSLVKFRRTIIQDSLQNNEHLLNKLGQTHDFGPFVPYINERDKLGRLLKEPKDLENVLQTKPEDDYYDKGDAYQGQIDQAKAINERSYSNSTPETFLSIAGENQLEKQQFSRAANRKLRDSHQRGKSVSETQVLSAPSNKQIRSTSSLIQQKLKLSQLVGGASSNNRGVKRRVGTSSSSSLLNVDSSNKLRASSYFNHSNNSFLGKTSFLQESLHENSQNKQKTHSFTQIISWNSQPPSPNRIPNTPQQQQPNNNNTNQNKSQTQNNKILEGFKFDKNNQMKQVDMDFQKRISALNFQHMLSRTKKCSTIQYHQEQQLSPQKQRKDYKFQRVPESVYQSQFFRMLFNHHRKIQAFNKMIDRNEFISLKDSKQDIDDRKMNGQSLILQDQNNLMNAPINDDISKMSQNQGIKQQQDSRYALEVSEKAEELIQQPFKSRIFKSVNAKYQKEEEEDREIKQNVTKEYEKWLTKQMQNIEQNK